MEPAIKAGSVVIGCRITGELQHGEVIVFRRSGVCLVKRIAGVPGDMVSISEEEASPGSAGKQSLSEQSLTVPDGYYYVLGDNEGCSFDSRHWEDPFVEHSQIIAVVSRR